MRKIGKISFPLQFSGILHRKSACQWWRVVEAPGLTAYLTTAVAVDQPAVWLPKMGQVGVAA